MRKRSPFYNSFAILRMGNEANIVSKDSLNQTRPLWTVWKLAATFVWITCEHCIYLWIDLSIAVTIRSVLPKLSYISRHTKRLGVETAWCIKVNHAGMRSTISEPLHQLPAALSYTVKTSVQEPTFFQVWQNKFLGS